MCTAARASRVLDDCDGDRELAAVRHREVDRARGHAIGPGSCATVQRHARLRAAGDLDVAPGERTRDAEAESLPDGLLAGETSCVGLRWVLARVAVRALGLREATLAERRVALE